jgi:hypothetical protein
LRHARVTRWGAESSSPDAHTSLLVLESLAVTPQRYHDVTGAVKPSIVISVISDSEKCIKQR